MKDIEEHVTVCESELEAKQLATKFHKSHSEYKRTAMGLTKSTDECYTSRLFISVRSKSSFDGIHPTKFDITENALLKSDLNELALALYRLRIGALINIKSVNVNQPKIISQAF